jgi:putative addiction module component (TIGR02574 family)
MKATDIPGVRELSKAEKMLLVQDLWDDIALDDTDPPIPASHAHELARRLEAYRRSPGAAPAQNEPKTEGGSKAFVPPKQHIKLSTGEVVKMLRELKGWTQEDLAKRCSISATNISALEHDRLDIGKKRAELLANAFGVHPAVIMFPEYDAEEIRRAA